MSVINNPYDDKELADIRSSQQDPIVQYFIVKKSLEMSPGKLAAQVGHGATIFTLYYKDEYKELTSKTPRGGERWNRIEVTKKWIDGSFRKVVLKANDSQFEKIKDEIDCFIVRDAGLTEVDPGSETVLVTFPIYKSKAPKIIQKLRVL